jgi:hypothetical protein
MCRHISGFAEVLGAIAPTIQYGERVQANEGISRLHRSHGRLFFTVVGSLE